MQKCSHLIKTYSGFAMLVSLIGSDVLGLIGLIVIALIIILLIPLVLILLLGAIIASTAWHLTGNTWWAGIAYFGYCRLVSSEKVMIAPFLFGKRL